MTLNNKEQKPITLDDLAALIKSEAARVESSLNNAIDELAAVMKSEVERLDKRMGNHMSRIDSRLERIIVKVDLIEQEVSTLMMNMNFVRGELKQMEAGLSEKVTVYRFDRFKKFNGLKEEHEAAAMTAK